jgi:hypothetical protein
MRHWHLWRITVGLAKDDPDVVDVNGHFFLDVFDDPHSACMAMAGDAVERYPRMKRTLVLEDLEAAVAKEPGTALLFNTGSGELTQWKLEECGGDCDRTRRDFDRNVRDSFTRFLSDYNAGRGSW